MKAYETIYKRLQKIYPDHADSIIEKIMNLVDLWKPKISARYPDLTEKEVLLITYGDAIYSSYESPLKTLNTFLKDQVQGVINGVHLLPMFPYSSDDGFSVIDFRAINSKLGDWNDICALSSHKDLMFDAVLNHCSVESDYFKRYLKQEAKFNDFFLSCDPNEDFSQVVRPRTSPLLTTFQSKNGLKHVWTTFSDDQVDLNYRSPNVLMEMLDVLLLYVYKGARYLRFDAIGFLWKTIGTSCIHLDETHELIKLMKQVIDECASGVKIITETNVAHKENISYFGNGNDEADLVYQFSLPPLTLDAFVSEDASHLTKWAKKLEPTSPKTTFFNFLASHDGIGLRPLEGILSKEKIKCLVETMVERGGLINYRKSNDGHDSPYEICINFMDALSNRDDHDDLRVKRFLASQTILLSMIGVPAIYYHSLLGSRNDEKGAIESKVNRRINREKLNYETLKTELTMENTVRFKVFKSLIKLIKIRTSLKAFSPSEPQEVLVLNEKVFAIKRGIDEQAIIACINVSSKPVEIYFDEPLTDIISLRHVNRKTILEPFEACWFKKGDSVNEIHHSS